MNEPDGPTTVEVVVVAELASTFVAETYTRFPGAVVPVTVTGDPVTEDRSTGLVTVSVVVPCV